MSDADKVSVQRLLQQFEHEIVDVNRRHIGEITGEIGKKRNRDRSIYGRAIK